MNDIDLYLHGDLGLWALKNTRYSSIKQVFTTEEKIADCARENNIAVFLENANEARFEPSHVGVSIHYPHILKKDLISGYRKIYNLHPGFLPWGRGYYPIFWALWEQTPAGATLHEITEKIDAGPIVAQMQVEYFPHDTGGSLFERIREAEKKLFLEYWPKIINGENITATPQSKGGSYHSKEDFFEIKQHANFERLSGLDLLRLIRCFTFPGYTGLEASFGNFRYEMRLEQLPDTLDNILRKNSY
ncbi:MAG: formyltransferase family protein [Nitrospirota bacterium]